MSSAIRLAGPEDLPALLSLVIRHRDEIPTGQDTDDHQAFIVPFLEGSSYGAVWLIGPARAPLGYVIITFAMSLRDNGLIAVLEDVYVRPNVRKRGIAREAVNAISVSLRQSSVVAMRAQGPSGNAMLEAFFNSCGFSTAPNALHLLQPI